MVGAPAENNGVKKVAIDSIKGRPFLDNTKRRWGKTRQRLKTWRNRGVGVTSSGGTRRVGGGKKSERSVTWALETKGTMKGGKPTQGRKGGVNRKEGKRKESEKLAM